MKVAAFLISLALLARPAASDSLIEDIGGRTCKGGLHRQPSGPFAVYVFCDDAVGTNIAVLYAAFGEPKFEKWTLTNRFWQSDEWGADVRSIGWLAKRNFLVVTTSAIYGEGAVYLLDLENHTFAKLAEPRDCGSTISSLSDDSLTIGVNDCEHAKPVRKEVIRFTLRPPSSPPN